MHIVRVILTLWTIGVFVISILPIVNYFRTDRARTSSLDKKNWLVMKGEKARQFVFSQFMFFLGSTFVISFGWLLPILRWVGCFLIILSIPFMVKAREKADRIEDKSTWLDIEGYIACFWEKK